jgi:hypothetical protein
MGLRKRQISIGENNRLFRTICEEEESAVIT